MDHFEWDVFQLGAQSLTVMSMPVMLGCVFPCVMSIAYPTDAISIYYTAKVVPIQWFNFIPLLFIQGGFIMFIMNFIGYGTMQFPLAAQSLCRMILPISLKLLK